MTKQCLHIIVTGLVQGVYFRANTQNKANSLGVTGWVKNLVDGRVEIMIEGEKKLVDQMLDWCKQGPPRSKVENIYSEYLPFQNKYSEFKINY